MDKKEERRLLEMARKDKFVGLKAMQDNVRRDVEAFLRRQRMLNVRKTEQAPTRPTLPDQSPNQ